MRVGRQEWKEGVRAVVPSAVPLPNVAPLAVAAAAAVAAAPPSAVAGLEKLVLYWSPSVLYKEAEDPPLLPAGERGDTVPRVRTAVTCVPRAVADAVTVVMT